MGHRTAGTQSMIDIYEYIQSKFPTEDVNSSGKIHTKCPFHDDNRPSFSIDVEKGFFICGSASCGVRGSFPLFYKLMENIDNWQEVFADLKTVSTDYKIEDLFSEKESSVKKIKDMIPFPDASSLTDIVNNTYLMNRNLGQDIINTFGLKLGLTGKFSGLYITNAIVCPVWNLDAEYKTFQIRCNSDTFRWGNPAGSPIQHLLYGGWLVNAERGNLWIVEGASDTWKIYSHGGQAVGLNTKEASPAQLNDIFRLCHTYNLKPIVCMDGDAHSSSKAINEELIALGLDSRAILLPHDLDPGKLSLEEYKEYNNAI
jgi:DNA primase